MICQEVMELMQRHIDDDLDQQETSLMEDHADHCSDCAAMLSRLQKLSNNLEQLPRVVPKYSLVDAILPELDRLYANQTADGTDNGNAVIRADSKPAEVRSQRPARRLWGRISGVVGAGIIAGILLISNPGEWSLGGNSKSNEASGPNPASVESQEMAPMMGVLNDEAMLQEGAAEKRIMAHDQSDAERNSGEVTGSTSTEEYSDTELSGQMSNNEDIGMGISGHFEEPTNDSGLEDEPQILSVPAFTVDSADGKWRAIAVMDAGSFQILNLVDNTEVYSSEPRDGQITLLNWNEESTLLYYTVTDTTGDVTEWQFAIATAEETGVNR